MKLIKMTNKAIIFFIFLNLLFANENISKAKEIMEKVISHPSPTTSISEIKLEIVRKRGSKTKIKSRAFVSYEKQYKNQKYKKKSLVKFLEPKSVKGTGLLSWIKTNGSSDQWFFLPKLKIAKKIKSKEKSKSFMSTDFIYEDLESRDIDDDKFYFEGEIKINGHDCAVISSTPVKESYYWGKKIFVDTGIFRIRKVEYFSENNELEKTLYFKDIVKREKYWFPKTLEMQKPNGNYTIMKVEAFKPDTKLDDAIFTESFLSTTEN